MRLTDLEPRWISHGNRAGVGISFNCPCANCRALDTDHVDHQRIVVFFEPPLDNGQGVDGTRRWSRTGDSFETLTLSPSIAFKAHAHGSKTGGLVEHWHGYVRGGGIITL